MVGRRSKRAVPPYFEKGDGPAGGRLALKLGADGIESLRLSEVMALHFKR